MCIVCINCIIMYTISPGGGGGNSIYKKGRDARREF